MKKYTIAIHGGAGTLVKGNMTPEKEKAYRDSLDLAITNAYAMLERGNSALEAVEEAIVTLENSPLFNAGKGSVFTSEGTHEMDASIMDGSNLKAGAVTTITGIKNPVTLAKDIMLHTEHVFLAGDGAMQFAKSMDYEILDPSYFYDELRHKQWLSIRDTDNFQLDHSTSATLSSPGSATLSSPGSATLSKVTERSRSNHIKDSKFGTVGAVALDQDGNIAAATSTGGMTNKRFGRVGDSPMIGAGTYANNLTCAVSCTGSGEYFIRGVVAYEVSALMEFKGLSLEAAASEVINNRLLKIGGDGGLIAVDVHGNVTMPFNTEGMYRAMMTSEGKKIISIYKD
ncbi:MAG: beta-aspartyl-peptidase (threonine type) [Saprospiraceae bacterium]|jgi:beta-aspartyl-peptidase (threonine type)